MLEAGILIQVTNICCFLGNFYEFFPKYLTVKELNHQLEGWLNAADVPHGPARAIIAPSVSN